VYVFPDIGQHQASALDAREVMAHILHASSDDPHCDHLLLKSHGEADKDCHTSKRHSIHTINIMIKATSSHPCIKRIQERCTETS